MVQNGEGQRETKGVELFHPVWDHEPGSLIERGGSGEKRCSVAVVAEAKQDEIKARERVFFQIELCAQLPFVVAGGGLGIELGTHAMDVCSGNRHAGKQ